MFVDENRISTLRQNLPWLCVALIFILAIIIQSMSRMNHDVSWLLYMASEALKGTEIYVDLIEVNPPLIIWLLMPCAWLSSSVSIPLAAAFNIYLLCLALGSLLLCDKYLKHMTMKNRGFLLLIITYVMTLLPASHFGQREHMLVIMTIPYLLLIIARKNKTSLPVSLVVMSAIMGGIGFCIKPYFLIIPVSLELYLLANIGIKQTFKRIEPYIIGIVCSLYVLFIIVFAGDYFSIIIPYALEVYEVAHQKPLAVTLKMLMLPGLMIVLGLYWAKTREHKIGQTFFPVFIIAACSMIVVALVQAKGWWSHVLPAQSYAIIGLCALLVIYWKRNDETSPIRIIQTCLIVALVGASFIPVLNNINTTHAKNSERLQQRISEFRDVNSFWIMSANLSHGFPIVTETNLDWGSRFGSLWLVPGVQMRREELGESSQLLDDIETYYWQAVTEDIKLRQPDVIFVDIQKEKRYFPNNSYNFIQDFSQYSDFRDIWSDYEKVGEFDQFFDIYQRRLN